MTNLVLCLNEYVDAGLKGNPYSAAHALGVEWQESVPAPMADRIILKGCTNVPDRLPAWMTVATPPPPPPMRCNATRKRLCMRSVMEAVESLRLPVITSNQAAALACELNRKLGL